MKRNNNFNEEQSSENKKQNTSKTREEESSLLLSMVDINVLQNIFIDLVDGYIYSTHEEALEKVFTLLLNFSLSCKLFFQISKQPLFPLMLNNININLNYKKYLKLLKITQLIKKEEDINDIFYQSCFFGYFDTINTLIKYGANINHPQGPVKWTPLITAANSGRIKTVQKLIKFKNLNINQQDQYQTTALIYSCACGKEDIVKLLISRKDIDINIKDNEGKTALDHAQRKNKNTVKILENYKNNYQS